MRAAAIVALSVAAGLLLGVGVQTVAHGAYAVRSCTADLDVCLQEVAP